MQKISLVIHGGAGTILKEELTPDVEAAYLSGLDEALLVGYNALEKGSSAVEAVKAATIVLENNILFNAGKGSVFTKTGNHEMDASIMDGIDLAAGAVAGLQHMANPIELAYQVMRNSNHVFLSGSGANDFATQQGFEKLPNEYFYSDFRFNQWQQIKDSETYSLDHSTSAASNLLKEKKFGTVGAAACDMHGNIAAATSTGGMTNKSFGRIGDTAIIGAGTYANNKTCAISCTGHGELFIRAVAAYDVSCLMEYKGYSLHQAMHEVTQQKLVQINGEGGMIGVDAQGNMALIFNSAGMYRGAKSSDGTHYTSIYSN